MRPGRGGVGSVMRWCVCGKGTGKRLSEAERNRMLPSDERACDADAMRCACPAYALGDAQLPSIPKERIGIHTHECLVYLYTRASTSSSHPLPLSRRLAVVVVVGRRSSTAAAQHNDNDAQHTIIIPSMSVVRTSSRIFLSTTLPLSPAPHPIHFRRVREAHACVSVVSVFLRPVRDFSGPRPVSSCRPVDAYGRQCVSHCRSTLVVVSVFYRFDLKCFVCESAIIS